MPTSNPRLGPALLAILLAVAGLLIGVDGAAAPPEEPSTALAEHVQETPEEVKPVEQAILDFEPGICPSPLTNRNAING